MATHQGFLGKLHFAGTEVMELRGWTYQDIVRIEDGLIAGAGEERPLPTVRGTNGTADVYFDDADAGQAGMITPGTIGALILYPEGIGSGLPQRNIARVVIVSTDEPMNPAEHGKRTISWQGGIPTTTPQT